MIFSSICGIQVVHEISEKFFFIVSYKPLIKSDKIIAVLFASHNLLLEDV